MITECATKLTFLHMEISIVCLCVPVLIANILSEDIPHTQFIQCALSNEILTQRYIHYSKPSAEHFSSAGRCFSSSLLLSLLYQGWPQGTASLLCFSVYFLFWICPCNWIMWQTFLYFLGTSGQSSPLFFQLYAALNPAQVSQWFF